jgi:undecaprenyl-diphosphatase
VNLPQLVVLALVEGVADILPIDASAHSLLAARLFGWQTWPIRVPVHAATVAALMAYLWRDIAAVGDGLWKLRRARLEPGTRLLAKVLVAALPWLLVVTGLGTAALPHMSDLAVIGVITLACAVAMGLADRLCLTVKRIEHIGGVTALVVGIVQLLGLVSGVGRMAAALTAARLLGMERPAAFRYVLLVSLPVLIERCGRELARYLQQGVHPGAADLLAAGVTFVLVLAAAAIGMSLIRRGGLIPFAVYRLLFGAALLVLGLL